MLLFTKSWVTQHLWVHAVRVRRVRFLNLESGEECWTRACFILVRLDDVTVFQYMLHCVWGPGLSGVDFGRS